MIVEDEDDYLMHYGILRRSGRYPWGSGSTQNVRNKAFLDYVSEMKKQGLSETEIAKGVGITTTQLRAAKTIAKNQQKQANILQAQRLKDKGYSNTAIGERMGLNESSVRALLAPSAKDKADILTTTSNMLKDQVAQKKYIDIGSGVEAHIGISKEKLAAAVSLLEEEGYVTHTVQIDQLGSAPGNKTLVKVIAPPGTPKSEITKNKYTVQTINQWSEDGGRTLLGIHPPLSIDSSRVAVKYGPEGGAEVDGVIYLRPGKDDLSLGSSRYAQVRIMVDGTHYIKGMAMYKDDLPKGVDILFNTNKESTGNKLDALKPIKADADNPFGSYVKRQLVKRNEDGSETVTSAMNIVNEEGDWDNWSRNFSSQFLSKQKRSLAKEQLDMTYERKKSELDEIKSLTNPAVRKKLLDAYSDDVDTAAVHLKAAIIPGTANHVILPIPSMKDNEIYAPNYRNGDRVALVRHPHGGIFEIPELTVNNNHPEAKKILGQAKDAVGINHTVASKLSGADFDGDTVLVIPNNTGKVQSKSALEGLKKFDPMDYKIPEGSNIPKITPRAKQQQMGDISNLITDMTIKGANDAELARAVRHSMVVIDAEKHNLNYRQSAIDNGIANLKEKYQGAKNSGASTLISRSGINSKIDIPEVKRHYKIDPETGEKIYTKTGASYVDKKTGKTVYKTTKVTRLGNVKDAHDLSSETPIENIYADHSNRLKALANEARKEMVNTKTIPYSPSAKEQYSDAVKSLNAKLSMAVHNRPLERAAQIIANTVVSAKVKEDPYMDSATLKKVKAQALEAARLRTGAKKQQIQLTQHEWNAIQAGAISNHKLSSILDNADLDQIKKMATPKTPTMMTSAKTARAKSMAASGYTQAEIAQALGVSLSTLKRGLED